LSGPLWVHEIKHDGYRLIVQRDGKRVRLFTRNGYDWTGRYPLIVEAALKNRQTSFVSTALDKLLEVYDGTLEFDSQVAISRQALSESVSRLLYCKPVGVASKTGFSASEETRSRASDSITRAERLNFDASLFVHGSISYRFIAAAKITRLATGRLRFRRYGYDPQ
jgi:bifunctional non-homologous end joining protein LigD